MLSTASRSLDLDKMELVLDDKVVKVYRFADEPEMPWFQAKPIVTYLDYNNITWALDRVDGDDKMTLKDLTDAKGMPIGGCLDDLNTLGYNDGKSIFINEPGLYGLILGSKKQEAKEFKRWVTHDVLPALRRHGHYRMPSAVAEPSSSLLAPEHLQQIVSALHEDLQLKLIDHKDELRRDFAAMIQQLVASSSGPTHVVHEATRNSGTNRQEQHWLRSHGRDVAAEEQAFFADLPLDITSFMEEKLEPEQHYVINHMKGQFASEVKRRRIEDFERTGNRFWVRYSQTEYRIAYTSADRDLLNSVWATDETKQYLQKQLESHRPVVLQRSSGRDISRPSKRRTGPYARPPRGGSEEVSKEALAAFFAPL